MGEKEGIAEMQAQHFAGLSRRLKELFLSEFALPAMRLPKVPASVSSQSKRNSAVEGVLP